MPPRLQMRKAGFRDIQAAYPGTPAGRGRLRSLQATHSSAMLGQAARAVWSLSCEWFLFCFTIYETSEDDEYLVMCENCKKLELSCPAVMPFRAGPAPAILWLLHCSASISRSRQKACGLKHQHLHRLAFDGEAADAVAWVLARPACVRWRRILFIFVSQTWQPLSQRWLLQISLKSPPES